MTLLEGVNDIGRGKNVPADRVTTEDLIAGYRQIIDRAHAHGIKVIGCTLTPNEGYALYWTDEGEKVRVAVNQWVRTSRAFDAIVDFDKATRDPSDPRRLAPHLDSGDHLHPSDAGYKAMADAIDLSIFTRHK
jgi:lysophospholipase L1-like esterase